MYHIPILWWDDGFGGDGAIMATIDGSGSAYPIGVVDNASRVIKYIGILGYRYSSYNLVDMRIHDINLVCDLNEQNPVSSVPPPTQDPPAGNDPVVQDYDGTSAPPESTTASADIDLEAAGLSIVTYWTGWWPLLHFEVNIQVAPDEIPSGHPAKPAEGKTIQAHAAKNILGITEQQDFTILGDGTFGQPSDEILNQQVDTLCALIQGALNLALIGLEIASNSENAPATAAFVLSTALLTLGFFGLVEWFQQKMLSQGSWNHYECFHQWLMIGLGFLINMFFMEALSVIMNFIAPLTPVQAIAMEWVGELNPIRTIAEAAKLAFFYMLAMAVCCFLKAIQHLFLSF